MKHITKDNIPSNLFMLQYGKTLILILLSLPVSPLFYYLEQRFTTFEDNNMNK